MQKYKKYHTDIKNCYALGIQNEILPDKFTKKIPNSTSYYWKYEVSEKYIGYEFSKSIQDSLDDTKIFLDHLELIVDGGSENNNKTITEFIKNCHVNINKKIALKDVTFSNSIVEGPYKIMKTYYFRTKEILSTTIYEELKFFVEDYNKNRPCCKHKIYTPNEVHQNPELANVKLILQKSNQQRLEENRNYCCKAFA